MKKVPTSRVDRLLGSMGYGSRAEMARMAKAGGIVLDGADLTDVSRRIPVTRDLPTRMEIDGEPLDPVQGLVILLNKPLAPAVLEVVSPTEALLTVTEGRYHQVRRMFAAAGNHVETLHRERLGGLALPADLAPGQWRLLTPEEIASIFV